MGWATCGDDNNGRPIGYSHDATCDEPGCTEKIHRGLAYACGGMHGDNSPDGSCDRYFCYAHLFLTDLPDNMTVFVCGECAAAFPEEES